MCSNDFDIETQQMSDGGTEGDETPFTASGTAPDVPIVISSDEIEEGEEEEDDEDEPELVEVHTIQINGVNIRILGPGYATYCEDILNLVENQATHKQFQ